LVSFSTCMIFSFFIFFSLKGSKFFYRKLLRLLAFQARVANFFFLPQIERIFTDFHRLLNIKTEY
jgi:hypothetical protein